MTAETEEAHDMIVKKVVDCARRMGVKFNKNKVQYKVKTVKLSNIFSRRNKNRFGKSSSDLSYRVPQM